jgi:hypothetical protein
MQAKSVMAFGAGYGNDGGFWTTPHAAALQQHLARY